MRTFVGEYHCILENDGNNRSSAAHHRAREILTAQHVRCDGREPRLWQRGSARAPGRFGGLASWCLWFREPMAIAILARHEPIRAPSRSVRDGGPPRRRRRTRWRNSPPCCCWCAAPVGCLGPTSMRSWPRSIGRSAWVGSPGRRARRSRRRSWSRPNVCWR